MFVDNQKAQVDVDDILLDFTDGDVQLVDLIFVKKTFAFPPVGGLQTVEDDLLKVEAHVV